MNAPNLRILAASAVLLAALLALSAPASSANDLKEGRAALQAGRYDDALRFFEKAAQQGMAEGRAGIGLVLVRKRQLEKAQESFEMAQRMDPNLALAVYGMGEVQRRQEKFADAVPFYEKAVQMDRKFPEAQLALGECLVQTKQHERAVGALNEGLKWGPRWRPRFLVALGDAELARDSLRDAGIYYTKAREEAPEDATPRRALGDFYMKRGTFELAVPEYQSALEKDTSDVDLRYRLGRALFYAQRYDEALQTYREVVGRDPEFAAGQLALGDLLYRAGAADPQRFAEARPYLERYVEMMPTDPKGWSVIGRTYFSLGLKDEAIAAMNKAEELGDRSKEMYTQRFRLQVERREYDKALADYERGEQDPEDQLRLAQVLVFQKQGARAESLYLAIVAADSTTRNGRFAMNELGKMRFRDRNYPEAVGFFQRRIALDPSNDEAYYYLGLSHKELKQFPEALTALRQSAALAETKPDRHFWVGILYAQLDSVPEAKLALRRVTELDSAGTNKNTGVAYRQLGFYQLLAKDYPGATDLLERAVRINDQDLQAWVWLGQGYQNSGNRGKACEAYQRALGLDPGQKEALAGRKSLGC